jgi:hypothetical protein
MADAPPIGATPVSEEPAQEATDESFQPVAIVTALDPDAENP